MDKWVEQEFYDFLTQSGVYGKIKLKDKMDFNSLHGNKEVCKSLDLYCPICGADKTFIRNEVSAENWFGSFKTHDLGHMQYFCQNLISKLRLI